MPPFLNDVWMDLLLLLQVTHTSTREGGVCPVSMYALTPSHTSMTYVCMGCPERGIHGHTVGQQSTKETNTIISCSVQSLDDIYIHDDMTTRMCTYSHILDRL